MSRKSTLSYQQFEQRQMLASVTSSINGGEQTLGLTEFQANEVLSLSESPGTYTFRLINGDTWSGNSLAGVSGIGSNTLTVDQTQFAEIGIQDDFNNRTLDVVFATDFQATPSISDVESVSQVAGTAVNLTSAVFSKALVLTQPNNVIDAQLDVDFVRLDSDNPIHIIGARVGSGQITTRSSVTSIDRFDLSTHWEVSGTLNVEAGTFIDIDADRFGVTGRMNLDAPEGIKIRSTNIYTDGDFNRFNGTSKFAQLNFNSEGTVDIEMTHNDGPFNGADLIPIHLVGDNKARSLRMIIPDASITDRADATLTVINNAEISANNVYLANDPTNVISVGSQATVRGMPQVFRDGGHFVEKTGAVFFADAGDVRFGSFGSESTNFLTLHEDDSTTLVRAGGDDREFYETQHINIRSAGDLEIGPDATIESTGWISLHANGQLVSVPSGNSSIKARAGRFSGNESIDIDGLEIQSLEFRSVGDVEIHAISDITLRGNNRAENVLLVTSGRIASANSTFVGAENLTLSGQSIWVGNRESEIFLVRNRLTLLARDFVIVGENSTVNAARLNVQTDFAKVHIAGNISFVGDNRMTSGRFFSISDITDALDATLLVEGRMELQTRSGSIYLADGDASENQVYFCGHTIFGSDEFVSVHRNGDVVLNSWQAGSAARTWINPDRRTCEG